MAKQEKIEHANKQLTNTEMMAAIINIDRRIEELNALLTKGHSDEDIVAIHHKLKTFLLNTFGNNSFQFNQYNHITSFLDFNRNLSQRKQNEIGHIKTTITTLETIKEGFQEELADTEKNNISQTIKAYDGLDLHPVIARAASTRYKNQYFADAIESSVKVLNEMVRNKSGITDKDGVDLMQHVFSPKKPILKFNNFSDESDKNEQKGFMDLFTGAVTGLRNPRAHKIIEDDPEMALEFIAFISLLAKLVDKAKKQP